jgi:YHS domain-containing protein
MNIARHLIALAALLGLAVTAQAGEFAVSSPAVAGYDVVSYQTGKRPIRGNGHYVAEHAGATYLFASQKNREMFQQDPDRYVPAYGGYCAFGVSKGKKFVGDPEVWRIVDNRLYLNLDARIQDDWLKDVSGYIKAADANWNKIKNKDPNAL